MLKIYICYTDYLPEEISSSATFEHNISSEQGF